MSRIPYLARRGNVFHFRIDVPAALRRQVGAREIVRTLATQDRRVAVPRALEFGAIVNHLFARLRDPYMNHKSMVELLEQAKRKLAPTSASKTSKVNWPRPTSNAFAK